MRDRELKRMLSELEKLTLDQRRQVLEALTAPSTAVADVAAVIEARLSPAPVCPHCAGQHVVRNGQADSLQRYKCRGCGRTFTHCAARRWPGCASGASGWPRRRCWPKA